VRVAIVGSGVSGLVSADLLSREHDVVLFESESRLGGHTHTVDVLQDGAVVPIDTGFIVFNTHTYPHFVRWLTSLGVAWQPSDMSFSVRSERRDFEYGSAGLNALFAQRRHLFSPRFHRMWRDVLRFYREARELLSSGDEVRLDDYLNERGYSQAFIVDHLLPLVGAVWSSNRAGAREFPARILVRFFEHHGFLRAGQGLQWLTIAGGSRQYVRAMQARFRGTVRLGSPIERIWRDGSQVGVQVRGHEAERFDHVVVACHADQALSLVQDATPSERKLLGAFRFQPNEAVLHTDDRLMPRRRRAWASWNYHLDEDGGDGACAGGDGACVTYWMNRLQSIPGPTQYFVTLNRTHAIDPSRIVGRFSYAHPFFTPEAAEAQPRHAEVIDHAGVSYCGAYWRNGFHEDGVISALRVCERLGVSL
jgi:predicted NAD/FAD-binding protein